MIGIYSMEQIKANDNSLRIFDSQNERQTQCTFSTLDDVQEWDEIYVENDYGEKMYAGILETPTIDHSGRLQRKSAKVASYRKILDRLRVNESYESTTFSAVVTDILNNYAVGFTQGTIEGSGTVDKVVFNFSSVGDCLTRLAKASQYEWYITYDKEINFVAKRTSNAPKDITDSSTFHRNLKLSPDVSNLANQVVVRGGTYQSTEQTFIEVADGEKTQFVLPEKPQATTVEVDTGGGYVSKTLGILFEGETPTTDFVVNYNQKYIANGTHATLSNGDKIRIKFKYQAPVRVRRRNEASIDAIKTKFPSLAPDGVFEKVVNDNKIDSKQLAYDLADAELDAYSNTLVHGSFKTTENIFEVSQVININTTEYAGSAVIDAIVSQHNGGTLWEHDVRFTTVLFNFEDFLRDMIEARKVDLIDSEVVETLYDFDETLGIADTITAETDTNRQTEAMGVDDDSYTEKGKSVQYVLGPYYPTGYMDTDRQFLLDNSPLA